MQLTQQHEEIRESARKFIESEINPNIDAWEKAGIFPAHEVFKKLGSMGFLGINKPTKYGGLGLDYSYHMMFLEALGYCNAGGVPMAIGLQTDMATPALSRFGSEELCREFLVPSITGDYVACLGVSEVGAGSDVASIKTAARKDGGDYVINGGKMWTTSGTQADWMCLLANTGEGNPHRNKSLICLPMKTKGVSVARKLDKMGMHCSDTAQIHFDDVRVPQRYLIGKEGEGFTYQMMQFQEERLYAAVSGLIAKDRMIDHTIAYTRERKAFGQSILDNQVVHFRMAELKTEVEMLRAITYRAADLMLKGEDVTMLASMAKLKAGRLSREITDSCLQYYGGMGFMNETLISRQYRDTRLSSIGGGADEIMLSIICKKMGILPGQKSNKSGN
jgi:citronellyl-CoA dehydrogenase